MKPIILPPPTDIGTECVTRAQKATNRLADANDRLFFVLRNSTNTLRELADALHDAHRAAGEATALIEQATELYRRLPRGSARDTTIGETG